MRYFLYISDAKVNMLLPQIPSAIKATISARLGFNVGVLSGELQTERLSLDDRIHRLDAVEQHLLSTQTLGTCDKPDTWIRGEGSAIVAQIFPKDQDAKEI
ncbi:MAG: SAVMC3_10250 family protein, partial [Mariprofundaceae bacterium]